MRTLLVLLVLLAARCEGAVAHRSSSTASIAASASPAIAVPANVVDGDFIVCWTATNFVHTISTVGNGFTQLGTSQAAGTDSTTTAIWKIASSDAGTWTFTNLFTGAHDGAIACKAYSGNAIASPISASQQGDISGGSQTHESPSITPGQDDCMIIALYGADPAASQSGTDDASPDATERVDFVDAVGTNGFVYGQDFLQTTAAAVSLTMTSAQVEAATAAFTLAIKPLAVSTPRRNPISFN